MRRLLLFLFVGIFLSGLVSAVSPCNPETQQDSDCETVDCASIFIPNTIGWTQDITDWLDGNCNDNPAENHAVIKDSDCDILMGAGTGLCAGYSTDPDTDEIYVCPSYGRNGNSVVDSSDCTCVEMGAMASCGAFNYATMFDFSDQFFTTGPPVVPCDPDQTIMKLYRENNSHLALWDYSGGDIPLYKCHSVTNGDNMISQYDDCEGVADYSLVDLWGYVRSFQVSGTIPIYRCYNSANTDHIVTDDISCEQPGYVLSGILGYISSSSVGNSFESDRCWSAVEPGAGNPGNHLMLSDGESCPAGYTKEDTNFYLFNRLGYNIDICYDDIFGVPYTDNLATVHSCSGKTPIAWLADTYNSHFSEIQSATYDTGICYGDLTCSVKATCGAGENEVISLVANTNTHASVAGTTGYPEKLCCVSTATVCGPAGPGETAVCDCQDLDTPNTKYVLQNDVSMTVDDVCFLITEDNITLDLNGHNVSSTYHPGTAILTDSQDTVIANGIVHGFEYGVYLSYSEDVLVENITFINNNSGWYALALDSSDNNKLNNLTLLNNFYGIFSEYSSDNTFSNIYMDQTTYLVNTYESHNNVFEDITSYNSHYLGLEVDSSINNTFTNIISSNNNYGSSTNGIKLWWAENNVFENLVANGNSNSGIYFDNDCINNTFIDVTANGNGVDGFYAEEAVNTTLINIGANNNGDSGIEFVDSYYNILKNIVALDNGGVGIYTEDSFYTDVENAVANDNGNSGIILESCGSNSLINATANNNYYLGVELLSGSYCSFEESYIVRNVEANYNRWDGIFISGHEGNGSLDISDVTSNYNGGWSLLVYDHQFIDIDGFVAITNETYGREGGIEFNDEMTNSTLKNIFIGGSEDGIILWGAGQNVTLDNITINNIIAGFSWVGMFVWEFENSSFSNISITNVTGIGFYLEDSNDNTLTNVIVRKSSEEGFYIENSNRNYFSNVVSEENGLSGLFTDATSLDSTFDDSSFCYNTIQDVNCSAVQPSFNNNFCNYDGSSCGGTCTACPSIFSSLVVWTDLSGDEIEEADVGDTVKMVRVGAPSGSFEIFEDDPTNDDELYVDGDAIVGVIGSLGLEGVWEITRDDFYNGVDSGELSDEHIEAFFLINSLRSKNLNISEDYEDEPMNITLISPFCGEYFMNGTESEIRILAHDPDSIIYGNITINDDVFDFSEGLTFFDYNWTTPGNVQVEVFAVNDRGYLRRTVTSVMVVEPGVTRDYVAACIDKPADFSDITTPNVRFSANKSLGLHCTAPVNIGGCEEVGNIGLDFSWRFSDGLINRYHEGDEELSYLFYKNFASAGHNWAVLDVKIV